MYEAGGQEYVERVPEVHEALPQEFNLLEAYRDTEVDIYGRQGTLGDFATREGSPCPVKWWERPPEEINRFTANILNASGVEIEPEHESHFRQILADQGIEFRLQVREPNPETEPDAGDRITKQEAVAKQQESVSMKTDEYGVSAEARRATQPASEVVDRVTHDVSSREAQQTTQTAIEEELSRIAGVAEYTTDSQFREEAERFADKAETYARQEESETLAVPPAAVGAAADARVEEEARYFAGEAEAYVRELKNESPVVAADAEQDDARTSDTEVVAGIEPVQVESETVSAQLTAGEADSTFNFEAVSTEEPTEEIEPVVDVHEQLDMLFEQFAVAEESEASYEVSDGEELETVLELDMTQEKLIAELDALFGEEGYAIVDSSVVAETIEPTAIDDTIGGEAPPYETNDSVEEAPVAQVIESYMQKVIENEPEQFAELPEMEQPEVLFEEMTQIVEAVQELAEEEELLGMDMADTKELYEQRLTVVVEKLLRTLDPDFDQTQVPDIVDRLLAERPERTTATDTLTEDATHERMSEPGYDISTDNDAKPWWLVGILVARNEFALAA